MCSLQPGALGQPGHVAPLKAQVVLEIEFLEGIPRFAQRLVKKRQQGHQLRTATRLLRHHPRHVLGRNFFIERRQGKIADQHIKVGPAGFRQVFPGQRAQGVKCARGKTPGLDFAAFDKIGQQQAGNFGQLVRMAGQ